jgi:hypothetical protein
MSANVAEAYLKRLLAHVPRHPGGGEAQHQGVAALLKLRSAESTQLQAWLGGSGAPGPSQAAAFLERLSCYPEARRPQALLPFPYDTFAALHLRVLAALGRGEHAEAYDTQEKLALAFLHAMEEDCFIWSQTVMVALFIDLRRLSLSADRQQRARGERAQRCDQAADKLRQGFSKVSNDKSPLAVSKKWAALHLINQIFKLLFSINQLSVGLTNLQRWVQSPLCPNHSEPLERRGFPKSQVVTCGPIYHRCFPSPLPLALPPPPAPILFLLLFLVHPQHQSRRSQPPPWSARNAYDACACARTRTTANI